MEFQKKEASPDAFVHQDFDSFYEDALSYSPEKKHDRWSVSWADLMMTMFIMFAVMYIYQAGDRELKFGPGPGNNHLSDQGSDKVVNINPQSRPLDNYDQAKQAIKDVMVDEKVAVDLVEDGTVRIVLAGDLLFDPGSADLKIGAKYQLDQIAKVLSESEFAINVVGHTDDTSTNSNRYPTNWELSSSRAVMVARYLTEEKKVDENRIFVSAHSFHQPVRPNDTSYNRSLNRRVEIILMKQKPYVK